jgi:hypothetical protein
MFLMRKVYENMFVKRSRTLDHWLAFGIPALLVLSVANWKDVKTYQDLILVPGHFFPIVGAAVMSGLSGVHSLRKKLDPVLADVVGEDTKESSPSQSIPVE